MLNAFYQHIPAIREQFREKCEEIENTKLEYRALSERFDRRNQQFEQLQVTDFFLIIIKLNLIFLVLLIH